MEEMKSMLVKLCEGQEKLIEGQESLEKHYQELKEEQIEIRKEQTAIREEQAEIRKEQTEIKQEQKSIKEDHKTIMDDHKILMEEHKDMKEAIHYLIELQKEMRKEMRQGFRELNERLAVCQIENGKKVDVLFDADETRKQHLEQHDKEIPEIKSTLFEHAMRIKNLESKVVGA